MGDDEDKYRLINYIYQENEKLDPNYDFAINTFFQALMTVLKNTFEISDETVTNLSPFKSTRGKYEGSRISPVWRKREDIGLLIVLTKEYSVHCKQGTASEKNKQTTPSNSF